MKRKRPDGANADLGTGAREVQIGQEDPHQWRVSALHLFHGKQL